MSIRRLRMTGKRKHYGRTNAKTDMKGNDDKRQHVIPVSYTHLVPSICVGFYNWYARRLLYPVTCLMNWKCGATSFWNWKPGSCRPQWFDLLAGTKELRFQIVRGLKEDEIRASWQPALNKYNKIRKKYLLYPDYR